MKHRKNQKKIQMWNPLRLLSERGAGGTPSATPPPRGCRGNSGAKNLKRATRPWMVSLAGSLVLLGSAALISLSSIPETAGASPSKSGTSTAFTVSGMDNIWGAGLTTAPDPGGSGGGVLPFVAALPEGTKTVTFSHVTGSVSFGKRGESSPNGPDGNLDAGFNTNISAYGGISGLKDTEHYFYLVGGSSSMAANPRAHLRRSTLRTTTRSKRLHL